MKRNYKLINQKPNGCVETCLRMICDRNEYNLNHLDTETLLKNFKRTDASGKNDGEFISITDLNKQFFEPHGIDLNETYFSYNYIKFCDENLSFFKENFEESDDDFILFVNYALLTFDKEELKQKIENEDEILDFKHCFLVSDIKDNIVSLVCPETEKNGGTEIIEVFLDRIYYALENQKNKSGLGYSIIAKN